MTRRRVEIVDGDPGVEQVLVIVRTTTAMLGASFLSAMVVSVTVLSGTAFGWLAVGVATLFGGYPAVAHGLRSRRPGRITLGRLPDHSAEVVARAGEQARRLRTMAEVSPPGPVADHFQQLAATADRYVVALHSSLGQAAVTGQERELNEDAIRVIAQLTELADAADELRQAQRRHLETSPLTDLTEATRRLTKVISASHDLDAEIP